MELFISEAEIEDASMIIDYLNQVGGESDNLTYGLNECYLNEFEEMEVIQDFIDQENGLLLCGFIDDLRKRKEAGTKVLASQLFLDCRARRSG